IRGAASPVLESSNHAPEDSPTHAEPRTRLNAPAKTRLLVFLELQRRGVHAVALAGRLGAVIEDVAQMAATAFTEDFVARHEEATVCFSCDAVFRKGLPKARPARTGIKLRLRVEKRVAAAGTEIGSLVFALGVFAGERPLRALFAKHVVLVRSQDPPPLLVGFLDLRPILNLVFFHASTTRRPARKI